MKAIVQQKFGDASVLSYEEIETPKIKDQECLIKSTFTSINYVDIKTRIGNKGTEDSIQFII